LNRKLPRRGVHRPRGTLTALTLGALRPGGRLAAFEREAAATFAVRHAVAAGSGRLALTLLLRALDLRPGDEVLLPALTFHAVPTAITDLGLTPVFVDVDPATTLIDVDSLSKHIGPRSRVVLATHLFGLPCDMARLTDLCDDHELVLLEDFAQASGARSAGRPLGSLGRAGFTSLETVKLMSAYGGGLVTTSDDALAEAVREIAASLAPPGGRRLATKVAMGQLEAAMGRPDAFTLAWPVFAREADGETWVGRYKKRKQGAGNHDASLHPAQAAAGRLSLRNLERHLDARRRNAALLEQRLEDHWWPSVPADDEPSWYQAVVRCSDPRQCAAAAREAGIDVGRDVVTDLSGGACATAARLARELIQLPSHPPLDERDLRRVAAVVEPWLL